MNRATPVRSSHTTTADLLTWSEVPPSSNSSSVAASRSASRSHQPSDGISKAVFGGQVTDEEADSLNKRKPCSGYKLREISGSNIFSDHDEDGKSESGTDDGNFTNRTSVRIVQQAANGISQISFSTEENVSPKKPITLTEVAKQRELSGNLEIESDIKVKKQLSDAKTKELSGNDIFGPPEEVPPRSLAHILTKFTRQNLGDLELLKEPNVPALLINHSKQTLFDTTTHSPYIDLTSTSTDKET